MKKVFTSLSVATPFTRALATLVAAGLLAEAAKLADGGELETESATDARYFIAVEVRSAISAAQASLRGVDVLQSKSS